MDLQSLQRLTTGIQVTIATARLHASSATTTAARREAAQSIGRASQQLEDAVRNAQRELGPGEAHLLNELRDGASAINRGKALLRGRGAQAKMGVQTLERAETLLQHGAERVGQLQRRTT